ncbi:MAG: hypothetical protein JWP34_2969 [Massilia sp.]|nr:hypothetical protein [Massilia sp.]
MLPTAPHSIRRQYLEVELAGSEADALALQRALPALSARALAPAIALALDRCAPAAGWLHIERLDIDAGSIAWSRLEQDLPAALQRALEDALTAQMPSGAAAAPVAEPGWRRSSAGQSLGEALAYFLVNGSLPSSSHLAPGMSFAQTLLAGWEEAAPDDARSAAAGAATLIRALAGATARTRLTAQFPPQLLQVLLARLTGHSVAAIAAIVPAFGADPAVAAAAARRRELLWWQALFARVAEGGAALVPQALAHAASEQLVRLGMAAAPAGYQRNGRAGRAPAESPPRPAGANSADIDAVPDSAASAPHPDADQGIFINNAGLVLLHPFLTRLFDVLALSEGGRLLLPDRALHLLHYLGTGRTGAPEYELVLPKVLSNVPLTQAVAPDIVLDDAECAEAQALLEAVIGHWSVLRNTGADGLRAAFLLRPGKLSRRNGDWLLQVEPDTADILLGQLPWGFSPVKLAWMDQLMWVEWG